MPSEGPKSGGTFASDNSNGGTAAWTNPGNAIASDNTRAIASLSEGVVDEFSALLRATNFGFTIPDGATIDGITVSIERHAATANKNKDKAVQLTKNGSAYVGTDKKDTGVFWPNADAAKSYGGAADLWGTTWTVAEINASTFGVAVAATCTTDEAITARVDHITITVTYTEAVEPTGNAADPGVALAMEIV